MFYTVNCQVTLLHSEHRAVALVLYLSYSDSAVRNANITFHTSCCWSESVASDIIRREPERQEVFSFSFNFSPQKGPQKGPQKSTKSAVSDIIRRKPERRGRSASALKYSTSPAKLAEKGAGH